MNRSESVVVAIAAVVFAIISMAIMAWFIQLGWNDFLVPAVHGVSRVGYWVCWYPTFVLSSFSSWIRTNRK